MIIEKRTMKTAEDMLNYADGAVGITADLLVFGGRDNPMEFAEPLSDEYVIPQAEKIRLAGMMLKRWSAYIDDCRTIEQANVDALDAFFPEHVDEETDIPRLACGCGCCDPQQIDAIMKDYYSHNKPRVKQKIEHCPFCKIRELEAAYEELQIMHSRDKEAAIKAERAADAYITRLEARLKQREERIHELSREITNYLNNGDIKLRTQVVELEQELDASKRFYANLLVNSGKEIRRLEELLNAMCGPGTAETMRRENL